ncbi:MAG: magnesium transporter [Clostridia bacterium]|nr:magnesium transporter [Clostridia bacterium]
MEENFDLHEQIKTFIEERHFKDLQVLFSEANAIDIAEALYGLSEKELILAFRVLPKEQAAETFAAMEREEQEMLIHSFTDRELYEMFGELGLDDAAEIVSEMPANIVARILGSTDRSTRHYINKLLLYPQDSAGSIMTPEYIYLRQGMTVEEAFMKIRLVGLDKETIYTCYVTENRKLVGVVSVRSMLIADPSTKVGDLMHENIISVKTTDDKEFVAGQIKKYGYLAIPVVDGEDKLVGIVTIDDAIEVIEEEANEDIQMITAITPDERPYLRSGAVKIWKQRVPWLVLLMLLSTFTSKILGMYEGALSACIVLNSFIPMIMGTGGNAGSQASVTIIRGLSLGEIKLRDTLRVIWKELRVSLLCGLTIAPVTFLKAMYLDGLYAEPEGFTIAIVISVTIIVTICAAKLVGAILPVLAKIVHLDPAVMASPFITVIVDALSLVVYFTFASMFVPALAG